ncbi:phenylalanine--tRNA ligase subunit beta [Candidatus Woesearchaeota archaeon]|nr:phenylalanine--tRNA ligase subunit beta [Candidatus Woesearchaeota archaeon]MBW2978598.1 phenylalanine--tRNA ligase subunit beta [Candidatus Woesearchaeota archaeon]
MPSINFSLKDLGNLVGKRISEKELKELLEYAKAEFSGSDGDEVSIQFNDTNLPYLWSVEGLAILFQGVIGIKKGIPEIKSEKSDYKIIVDRSIRPVRPFISAFVAKGGKLNDFFLKQIIQLQEKFCENFGRRRQKVAIGLYPVSKISFPVSYSAVPPKSVKFVPLDSSKSLSLAEILEEHPKGREYAWILKDTKKYPLLCDANKEILSFPPIINSSTTGKLGIDDCDIFFEATGTDLDSVNLASCIFAHALSLRGFSIFSTKISYVGKSLLSPDFSVHQHKLDKKQVESLLGLELKDSDIKRLLEKARFNVKGSSVEIPCFRNDIMHSVDLVEEIGIMYGFDNISELPLSNYTVGGTSEIQNYIDKCRDIIVGLGYQEIMSPILTSKEALIDRMNLKHSLDVVEISNPASAGFSVLRSWILPGLMDVLMKNKHVDFPQKLFEQGLVSVKDNDSVFDNEHIAGLESHISANFTKVKQSVDFILRMCGLDAEYEDFEHNSFISGRAAKVIVKNKEVGFVGEFHPAVLTSWGLDMPVAGFEINLSELFRIIAK